MTESFLLKILMVVGTMHIADNNRNYIQLIVNPI